MPEQETKLRRERGMEVGRILLRRVPVEKEGKVRENN